MTVTGGFDTNVTVTFNGTLAGVDVPQLRVVSTEFGKSAPPVVVTTVTNGAPGTNEVQRLTVANANPARPFGLKLDVLGGVFRSTDGGGTFTRAVAGSATDLVKDPDAWIKWYYDSLEAGEPLAIPEAASDDQTDLAQLENHLMWQGQPVDPADYDPIEVHVPIHRSAQIQARLAGAQTHRCAPF